MACPFANDAKALDSFNQHTGTGWQPPYNDGKETVFMVASCVTPTTPEIITDDFLTTLREHGAVEAYVFGSMTRGEERPDSDLDLLVTFNPPISLFDRLDLAEKLAGIAGRNVDLLEEIHPYFAP